MRYDGGFTHGRRCGTYDLRKATNSTKLSRDATTDIAWPAFLRRAQSIRFEITALPPLVQRLPCLATVLNVLHSVCNFLQSSQALRSLTANLSSLSARNGASRNMHRLLDGLTASVCPLRQMPHGQNPQIYGVPYETDDLLTASPLTLSLADELLSGSTWSLLRQTEASENAARLLCMAPIPQSASPYCPQRAICLFRSSGLWEKILGMAS